MPRNNLPNLATSQKGVHVASRALVLKPFFSIVRFGMDGAPLEPLGVRIAQCAMWEKVKEGHVHLITTDDIQELFNAFEIYDPSEHLPTSELVRLCSVDGTYLTAEDIGEWIKDADCDGNGKVSIQDVHRGITEGTVAFSLVKRALFGAEKDRRGRFLVQNLQNKVFVCIYIIVFNCFRCKLTYSSPLIAL